MIQVTIYAWFQNYEQSGGFFFRVNYNENSVSRGFEQKRMKLSQISFRQVISLI